MPKGSSLCVCTRWCMSVPAHVGVCQCPHTLVYVCPHTLVYVSVRTRWCPLSCRCVCAQTVTHGRVRLAAIYLSASPFRDQTPHRTNFLPREFLAQEVLTRLSPNGSVCIDERNTAVPATGIRFSGRVVCSLPLCPRPLQTRDRAVNRFTFSYQLNNKHAQIQPHAFT
jgi:hypothetical protein